MFAPFLCDGVKWTKKLKANATRGFVDDTDVAPLGKRLTAAQKVIFLELMLEQIAKYVPTIARSMIICKAHLYHLCGRLFVNTMGFTMLRTISTRQAT